MSAPDDDLGVGKRKREKESKHGGLAAAQEAAKKGISALDQLELEEQDDVYDLVDDEEYEQIVEKRREEGDFVVDDEGIGYHDDGEEVLGISEDPSEHKRRMKEGADNDRKVGKSRKLGGAQTNDMMKFVKTGANSARSGVGKMMSVQDVSEKNMIDIDALMGGGKGAKGKGAAAAMGTGMPHQLMAARRPVVAKLAPRMGASMGYAGLPTGLEDLGDDYGFGDAGFGADEPFADSVVPGAQAGEAAAAPEVEKINLSKPTRKIKTGGSGPDAAGTDDQFKPALSEADLQQGGMSEIGAGAADAAGAIDPRLWLRREPVVTDAEGNKSGGEEYLNLFWIDIHEKNGVIYLVGKVALSDPDAPADAATRYASCCVAVYGVERNLFVLPKATGGGFHADGTPVRASMMDVYSDLKGRLMGPIIPKTSGQSFKVKSVKRKYAFEHGDVPREETEYLKVVYAAKFPAIKPEQCAPSECIERIFGADRCGVSLVEAFLLKRRIMGPCWLTIKNPRNLDQKSSHCKLEVGVESAKFIREYRPPAGQSVMPSPPLVSMSIAIKTAINPIIHKHEVIAISGLVHTRVEADNDSEARPSLMKRFTYIRPLGNSCGSAYPASFPHDLPKHLEVLERQNGGKLIETFANERAMLSRFFMRIQQEDPDILASHNLFGFEFDVLLDRAAYNKVQNWDRIGRLRKDKLPKSIGDRDAISGRLLVDTYKAAKEFLRETTYSLTHLAESQLNSPRIEVDPVDVPRFFGSSSDVINIARHTQVDALLVQRLMLKLQIVPLTKALTNVSGNVWARTLYGARAERIELLLLHRFHFAKYILPEKKPFDNKGGKGRVREEEPDEDTEAAGKVKGMGRARAKAAYAGGLVLEPKKGLYDHFILLLDFNSLYPSIIQEYNLCFTTVNWTKYMMDAAQAKAAAAAAAPAPVSGGKRKAKAPGAPDDDDEDDDDDDEEGEAGDSAASGPNLPPLPDSSLTWGILPTVIKELVDRRKAVKSTQKTTKNKDQWNNLEIRQKAYKLTANSMYGCLGFSFSRFYARPIAALVTSKGREALQRTVDQAVRVMNLDVIYGDTDSVMINTNSTDYKAVMELGMQVKTAVNKLYKSLELDIDGVFKSMLLLKKKKYAALVIKDVDKDGNVHAEKEMKGLDLVRRDWCPLSKDTGKFIVEQILSGRQREEIVMTIHDHLAELSTQIRAGSIDLKEFVVTKGLNKNPKDYPDCKGQAHLQVALQMLKNNRPVNIGDHIPYVICKEGAEGSAPAQRAHHPDDVYRSNGELTLDFEWYLSNQILPPISRLCEPIEGTSQAILSAKLGLDASKYAKTAGGDGDMDDFGFTPRCKMEDAERFKNCSRLVCKCLSCGDEQDFCGSFNDKGSSGLNCQHCGAMYLGQGNIRECYSYLSNRVTLLVRECVRRYYESWLTCDDASCKRHTMQQSVVGFRCTEDCHGRMTPDYSDLDLHTQLKFVESLFDLARACEKRADATLPANILSDVTLADIEREKEKRRLMDSVPTETKELLRLLFEHMKNAVQWNAYNWVRPSLWSAVFGKVLRQGAN